MGYTTEQSVEGALECRANPELFHTHILDVEPENVWPKMREVINSVRDHRRTAVKAGHSVSKTYTAARIALEFLYDHGPNCTVITTAPTDNQVVNVLWRDIRTAKNNARADLPGEVLTQKLEIDDKWFAIGFATKPDTVTKMATAFQGFHNEYVLVIFDEAAGILPQIWDAAESLIVNERCRWLVIGNPTSSFGDFANCFKPDSGWNQITISVKDTPNYQAGYEIIPGLSGREFATRIEKKYGINSNMYLSRVLGEIPEYAEGAIFGAEIKLAKEQGRILDKIPHEISCPVHTAWDLGISGSGNSMAIWFFQVVQGERRFIHYLENWDEGMMWYIETMHALRTENNWLYGKHIAPHDIMVRELSTGATRFDTAREMGIQFTVGGKMGEKGAAKLSLLDGIEAGKQELNQCWFDRSKCGQGLKALSEYHWKKLEAVSADDRPVYSRMPEHDASSNGADAFRMAAIAFKYNLTDMLQAVGTEGASIDDWSSYYGREGLI